MGKDSFAYFSNYLLSTSSINYIIAEVNTKSTIYLYVNKARCQNVSIAVNLVIRAFLLTEKQRAGVDNFTFLNPDVFIDELVILENSAVGELSHLVKWHDASGQ